MELLIADIGLMKIYQRTALNKEFYDYRNSAVRRMKRIAEDNNLFVDRHERMRLTYARSEFYIVSAIYYYYLQQRPEALASINEVPENGVGNGHKSVIVLSLYKRVSLLAKEKRPMSVV